MKKKDKSKFALILMSIALVLSMSVTVTLAAFAANKSGSVTLTFAEGLVMILSPHGYTGRVTMTGGGANEYTFSYPTQTNVSSMIRYDGIHATLNKSGWISLQIVLKEQISGSDVVIPGSWTVNSEAYFIPSGTNNKWHFNIDPNLDIFTISSQGSTLNCIGKVKLENANEENTLWQGFTIRNIDYNRRDYLDDLAGRTLKMYFTIKARTDAAPTF